MILKDYEGYWSEKDNKKSLDRSREVYSEVTYIIERKICQEVKSTARLTPLDSLRHLTGQVMFNPLNGVAYSTGLRIYNYALTEAQIKQVYNAGAAIRFAPATGSP